MVRATLTVRVERLEDTMSHLARLPAHVEALGAEISAGVDRVRAEMRAGFETLRAEIREGDEETRRYMRVLYEDLVERIKTMSEGIDDLRQRP
jgi:hypothetical protein